MDLKKVVPPTAQPSEDQWVPHKPGFEMNTRDGTLRTCRPLPPPKPEPKREPEPVDVDVGFCGIFKGLCPATPKD